MFVKSKEIPTLCNELDCKFSGIEEQVKELKPRKEIIAKQVEKNISSAIDATYRNLVELEKEV